MRFRWGFLVKGKGSELLGLNKKQHPGGGFIFFLNTPNPAEMIQFDDIMFFQMGWFNHHQS